MSTYLTLFKWTEDGARYAKQTVERTEQAIAEAERLGGRVIWVGWTQGAYDVAAISDWPDEDSLQAFLLQLATVGAVHSETLRAFSKEDMRRILSKLPA